MRVRAFTVPFAKVVGEDATEIEYGPDDYLVVRPLFGLPSGKARQWADRIERLRAEVRSASTEKAKDAAGAAADALVIDFLREQVDAWRLEGVDGQIPKPSTPEDLNALPFALRAGLFAFIENYRGDGPNPTTSG